MPGCAVASCFHGSRGYFKHFSFFRFPKDAALRQKWISKCGRRKPVNPDTERICSAHFLESDFCDAWLVKASIMPGISPVLKPGAVPSVNVGFLLRVSLGADGQPKDGGKKDGAPKKTRADGKPYRRIARVGDPATREMRHQAALEREERQKKRERKELVEQLLNNPTPLPPIIKPPTHARQRKNNRKQQHEDFTGTETLYPRAAAGDSDGDDPWQTLDVTDLGGGSDPDDSGEEGVERVVLMEKPRGDPGKVGMHERDVVPHMTKEQQTLITRTKEIRTCKQKLAELELRYAELLGSTDTSALVDEALSSAPVRPGEPAAPLVVLRRPRAKKNPDLLQRLQKHRLPDQLEVFPPKDMGEAIELIHKLRLHSISLKEEVLKWAIRQKKRESEKAEATGQQLERVKMKAVKRKRLKQLESIESSIKDVFTDQQVKAMSSSYLENAKLQKKVVHWKEEDLRKTLELRAASSDSVVNFVRQKLRIPLPCLETVKKRLDVFPELRTMWKEMQDKTNKKSTFCAMCERQLNTIDVVAEGGDDEVDVGVWHGVQQQQPAHTAEQRLDAYVDRAMDLKPAKQKSWKRRRTTKKSAVRDQGGSLSPWSAARKRARRSAWVSDSGDSSEEEDEQYKYQPPDHVMHDPLHLQPWQMGRPPPAPATHRRSMGGR